ncbi:MAG: M24 family metallopeptidase [Christensenellales bacterium]
MKLTKEELNNRRSRFCKVMDERNPDWDTAVIMGKANQYYFMGTMQDAVLLIRKGGAFSYHVRRSLERALDESPFDDNIYPMLSYRDAAQAVGSDLGITYIETEVVTYAIVQRFSKHFKMAQIKSLEGALMYVRSVKNPYEMYWVEKACATQHSLLMEAVPGLLKEGISEADFVGELQAKMMQYGYHGITRFYRFQTELVTGQVGFGISSLYPTSFDGPGGALGTSAAAPVTGRRDVRLKKGDLVFVDCGFGMEGYHSDKTQVYMFGAKPSPEAISAHRACIDIEQRAADMLRPGIAPSEIYNKIMGSLDESFLENFMGFGQRSAKFLGHGVGMFVDEMPIIAAGFDEPLQENMTIALEPKKGIAGLGMVGVEDTYAVTPSGGRCLSGGGCDIIVV